MSTSAHYKDSVLKLFPNARKEMVAGRHIVCLEPTDTYESASRGGACRSAKDAWRYAALIDAPNRKAGL